MSSTKKTPIPLSLKKPEYSPPPDSINPQQVSDFDYEKRLVRDTLTLTQRPADTIITFLRGIVALGSFCVRFLYGSLVFKFGVIPFLLCWTVARQVQGPHVEYMSLVEFGVEFFVWWVGLGILSSVGLGSGLQSGVLFMYPHIIKVCFTAQFCNSLEFESATDMWFRAPSTAFVCPANSTGEAGPALTLFGIWKKIILVCFLQATGTALGEIPPYWMTRAARLAAMEAGTDTPDEMPEELESNANESSLMNSSKKIIVWLLSEYGFYGVLLMASFPNIAFDLCGICCGHFLMPFWTFFLATFFGKAVIRNFYQSVIYVLLCSEDYMEKLIGVLQRALPDGIISDHHIRLHIESARENFNSMSSGAGEVAAAVIADGSPFNFMVLWKMFMSLLLTMFFLSLISHFAQYYQMTIDQELSNRLRRKMPAQVRQEISSPSGRLRLPVPTPLKTKTVNKKLTELASAQKRFSPEETILRMLTTGAATGSKTTSKLPRVVDEGDYLSPMASSGGGTPTSHCHTSSRSRSNTAGSATSTEDVNGSGPGRRAGRRAAGRGTVISSHQKATTIATTTTTTATTITNASIKNGSAQSAAAVSSSASQLRALRD